MRCQSCGKILRHNVKFCEYCGVKIAQTCPSCGHDVSRSDVFCELCGAKLNTQENTQEPPKRVVRIKPVQEDCDTIQSKTRIVFTSPLFITVVIAYTLGVILSIIGGRGLWAKLISSDAFDYIYQIAYWLDLEDGLSDIMRFLFVTRSGITVGSILRNIPAIVICIGLWQVFISSTALRDDLHGTPAIRFIVALKRVAYSVLLAGISLALIYLMIEAHNTWLESVVTKYGLIALLVSWIVLLLIIKYYTKTISAVDLVDLNSKNNMRTDPISGYVIIANYIIGIGIGISSLINIDGLSGFLMNVSMAVFYIALGALMARYDDTTSAHQIKTGESSSQSNRTSDSQEDKNEDVIAQQECP